MKVLVLGGGGMLGHKVFQVLQPRFETYATFRTEHGLWEQLPFYSKADTTLGGVDVTVRDKVAEALRRTRPDAVINCVGIVKQRREAEDPIASISVNALFPHELAALCLEVGSRLIHISTDCVFSGRKGRYREEDLADPDDLYGRTKLLGEVMGPGCLTLRTSLIGRDFLGSLGLLEWFFSRRGTSVKGYRNAIFSGFTTQSFAGILVRILERYVGLEGLYHVASEPIDKYNLLRRIRDAMDLDVEIQPAEQPRNDRSLDGSKFVAATKFPIPSWEAMIAELAKDDTPYDDWRRHHGIA
jgi:dTDP-4-dehydrorhamnose reductase